MITIKRDSLNKPGDLHAKDIRIKVNFTEKFINQFNYSIQLAPSEVRKYNIALESLDERRKGVYITKAKRGATSVCKRRLTCKAR